MDFEAALTKIGEFGRYQRLQYFLVNLSAIPMYFQYLIGVFIAAQPKWQCIGDSSEPLCLPSGKICSKPLYTSNYTSIATEWNLVCNNAYKTELAQSVLMAGFLVGGFGGGIAADRYGRKAVWFTAIVANCLLGSLCAFSTSLNIFFALRFIHGIFIQAGSLSTFVLSTEMIGSSYRGLTGMYVPIFAAISFVILAWLANIFRDWRTLLVISVAPQIVSLFFTSMISESPRWLLLMGRVKEAEDILNDAGHVNGITNPRITLKKLKDSSTTSNESTAKSFMAIFTKRSIRPIIMVMMVSFAASGVGYFGLSLNVRNLGGNIYLNFALSGLVEIPSYILGVPLLERLGRRKTNFVLTLGGAIACLICMRLQQINVASSLLVNGVALLGKFCISAANAVIYIYAAELFPTVIRNMALGVCVISTRVGAMAAPFIVLLGNENKSLPMQIIAVMTIVAAFLGLKLPETQGRSLPQTFEDLDENSVGVSIHRKPIPL